MEYLAGVRIHRNQLLTRALGTLAGIGFLAMGAYAMFGADDTVAALARERAWWFGACAAIAGVWAIAVSWLDPDLSGVWCRPPRRPRDFRH
jgi:hypothetical protein